ncbi:MAG: NUDIX domain-containing protein [Saprospiraceae bacterium]
MLTFSVRLIVEKDGKLLFLRQTKKNGGKYSLIGGNVEDHEFAREALAREAREESGIVVSPDDMRLVHVLHRHKLKKDQVFLVLYFRADRFQGEPASLEPAKFQDVRWIDKTALPDNLSKSTRHVLEALDAGQLYSEFPSRSQSIAFWEQIQFLNRGLQSRE